jgi:hypothetical protein
MPTANYFGLIISEWSIMTCFYEIFFHTNMYIQDDLIVYSYDLS